MNPRPSGYEPDELPVCFILPKEMWPPISGLFVKFRPSWPGTEFSHVQPDNLFNAKKIRRELVQIIKRGELEHFRWHTCCHELVQLLLAV